MALAEFAKGGNLLGNPAFERFSIFEVIGLESRGRCRYSPRPLAEEKDSLISGTEVNHA